MWAVAECPTAPQKRGNKKVEGAVQGGVVRGRTPFKFVSLPAFILT